MESITARLRHIMELHHMNQRKLADRLRLDPSNLSKVLSGKLPFTEGLVNRIVIDLGISKKWLTTGEGLPYEKPSAVETLPMPEPGERPGPIPVYDIDVTAGCRSLEMLFGEVAPIGTIDIPGLSSNSAVVKVRGDSMSPRISNGGYVAVRRIKDMRHIAWGQIYVVELEEYRLIKYLRRHPDPSQIVLHSDNPEYDDMDVDRADIRKLYVVEAILNYEVQ